MEKLETFIIVKRDNLEKVSEVRGFKAFFNKKYFTAFIVGGWLLSAILVAALMLTIIGYSVKIHKVNKIHERHIAEYELFADSLGNVIEDNASLDSLMVRLFDIIMESPGELTHDKLWEYIKSCSPWYPDIIMMQAVQESGCGKSPVAKRTNNLFGMKKPYCRKWRCDINRGNKKEQYMEFEDWRWSVIDRILWDRWLFREYKRKPTIDEYMKVIDSVYNTETAGYSTSIYKNAAKYRKMLK